ncbi:MAG: amino acid ABC transporter substrate-binding protein [Deltaproteobacteria bacterium]|nr:MAG: amino acid ABC transporter substrate-binding protein [Deltaproteobacteria bacterium]
MRMPMLIIWIVGSFFVSLIKLPANVHADVPDAIRVGATVSVSGKFATEVGPFQRLLKAWADEVNRRGGLYLKKYNRKLPLQLVTYDDRSDAATARRYYERLVTVDGVHLLFGPYSSPLTFAASTASEQHQVPFIAICANSPKVYDRGFKWIVCIIDAAPRYTYRYWEMVQAEAKARSVGFVVEDTLHPVGVYKGSRKLAEQAGLKVLVGEVLPADTGDFTPIILKLKKLNPDIVYVSSNIPFAVAFMKQAKELNLSPREFHCIHHSGVFRQPLGPAADYVLGQSYWEPGMKYSDPDRFLSLLKEAKIDLDDYPWSPAYMMAFEVAEAAMNQAGTLDPAVLMKTMKGLRITTLGGPVWFADNGVGTINTYPSQIQHGKYQIVWPAEVATAKHIYPTPAWADR